VYDVDTVSTLGNTGNKTKRPNVIVSATVRTYVVHELSLRQDRVLQNDERLELHHSDDPTFNFRLFFRDDNNACMSREDFPLLYQRVINHGQYSSATTGFTH
jgi:hypothetical protein